jgi:hypothetical protein
VCHVAALALSMIHEKGQAIGTQAGSGKLILVSGQLTKLYLGKLSVFAFAEGIAPQVAATVGRSC